jgi:hypothetical protein
MLMVVVSVFAGVQDVAQSALKLNMMIESMMDNNPKIEMDARAIRARQRSAVLLCTC